MKIAEDVSPELRYFRNELHSPDQLRYCLVTKATWPEWRIIDAKTHAELARIPANGQMLVSQFIDNDNLEFEQYLYVPDDDVEVLRESTIKLHFHRRFPEWWWGHFYRPEVWCAIVLTALLGWRFAIRNKTSSNDTKSSSPCPSASSAPLC